MAGHLKEPCPGAKPFKFPARSRGAADIYSPTYENILPGTNHTDIYRSILCTWIDLDALVNVPYANNTSDIWPHPKGTWAGECDPLILRIKSYHFHGRLVYNATTNLTWWDNTMLLCDGADWKFISRWLFSTISSGCWTSFHVAFMNVATQVSNYCFCIQISSTSSIPADIPGEGGALSSRAPNQAEDEGRFPWCHLAAIYLIWEGKYVNIHYIHRQYIIYTVYIYNRRKFRVLTSDNMDSWKVV